jgi:hypothetical protein
MMMGDDSRYLNEEYANYTCSAGNYIWLLTKLVPFFVSPYGFQSQLNSSNEMGKVLSDQNDMSQILCG